MSIRSGLLAALTTIVLTLVLGNVRVVRQTHDGGEFAALARGSITGNLRWQVWELPSQERGAVIVHLVALVLLAAVLGAIVGRARPLAAFVGGWGAFLAAAMVSSGVYGIVVDDIFTGRPPDEDVIDTFTATASFGTALGMWLGWLVGLAVMLGSFGADRTTRSAPPAPPPGGWGSPGGDPQAPTSSPFGPAAAPPPPPPATPSPGGGPVIGTPPDRTQVFGEPPTG